MAITHQAVRSVIEGAVETHGYDAGRLARAISKLLPAGVDRECNGAYVFEVLRPEM